MKNKIFTRIIITTLLCAFLTFNVGKVTRVSAVGTSVAAIGTMAFIATGLVYISYLSLTGATISVPRSEDISNWLGGIGKKVAKYPSGSATYQEMYQYYAQEPLTHAIDGVWSWTQEKLKSFINDFANVGIIGQIVGEYTSSAPLAQFDYTGIINDLPTEIRLNGYGNYTIDDLLLQGYSFVYSTEGYRFVTNTTPYIQYWYNTNPVRNLRYRSGNSYLYTVQEYVNGEWVQPRGVPATVASVFRNDTFYGYLVGLNANALNITTVYTGFAAASTRYPQLIDVDIYDASTGELIRALDSTQYLNQPNWNDDENRPIVPWVPIPDLPTGVPTPPGYSVPQWGFPLQDLLDLLESLAEGLMSIDAIARLINEFAGQHGDNYYLEYNDGDTNYYTYYQPMNFDNDTEYVTYNINIEEQQDIIPVDLNTVSLYTNNRYLDNIKQSAMAGSSILRDLVVFWYDIEPEIAYIALGSCLAILLGAFIGKWGHS